jgi:hypothetical protein
LIFGLSRHEYIINYNKYGRYTYKNQAVIFSRETVRPYSALFMPTLLDRNS